jgi:hypothetical protein
MPPTRRQFLAATATALPALLEPPASEDKPVATATVSQGDLTAVFRDNSQSPKVLSGVASLVNQRDAPGFDAFDPDSPGASAGLNFEHVICGHRNANNGFAPATASTQNPLRPSGVCHSFRLALIQGTIIDTCCRY